MSPPTTRVREGFRSLSEPPVDFTEKGYQPQEPPSAQALAKPPRGGSHIRLPATPPKK